MDLDVDGLTDDELRAELTTWAGRVAAGEAVLLRLIGELDAREAWGQPGVLSCAHWVSWRLGVGVVAAREKVRVARALRELPLTSATFAQGGLSYAQVRAITRVATVEDEQRWLELARHSTAEQLEKAGGGVSRSRRNEERAADPETTAWQDRARFRVDENGNLVLTVVISPEHAPAVMAALEQAQQLEQAERDARLAELAIDLAAQDAGGDASAEAPDCTDASAEAPPSSPEPYVFVEPDYPMLPQRVNPFEARIPEQDREIAAYWEERGRRRARAAEWHAYEQRLAAEAAARHLPTAKATLGDALVRALTRPSGTAPTVKLLVDPVSGWARTTKDDLLPPSTLKQILRSLPGRQALPRVRPLTPADLLRQDQGRRNRDVTPKLRELLGQLDGERCRFPSCTRHRKLHAHHVLFWSDGGPTDLSNLILVCGRHHTLIHQQGFRLVLEPDRTLTVHTADGTRIAHHPALPWEPAEDLPTDDITPDTLPTQWTGERMDLGYVVTVMLQHAA